MEIVAIDGCNYASVAKIYAAGIATKNATFETKVPIYEDWNAKHFPFGRIAVFHHHLMVGWAALSKVSDRCVYQGVVELSIYVTPSDHRKGIGSFLMEALITSSEDEGIWSLQSSMMPENKASELLHLKHGFRQIGYREKIGQLDGIWRDNLLFERRSKKIGIT